MGIFEDILNMGQPWQKDWTFSKTGDLTSTKTGYCVTCDRLTEPDWILHMSEKTWVDMNTFVPAFFRALEVSGHRSVRITTSY